MDLAPDLEERSEEAEALDVTHVQVRQEDVDRSIVTREGLACLADSRTRVEQEDRSRPSPRPEHRRCFRRTEASLDRRSPATPGFPGPVIFMTSWAMRPGHRTTRAPSSRPPPAASGTAVASTECRRPSNARIWNVACAGRRWRMATNPGRLPAGIGRPSRVARRQHGRLFIKRQRPELIETASEDVLRRFVVEEHVAMPVDEKGGDRKVARQAPGTG